MKFILAYLIVALFAIAVLAKIPSASSNTVPSPVPAAQADRNQK
jgi:hypothetical protein